MVVQYTTLDQLDAKQVKATAERYKSLLTSDLKELDEERYDEIPRRISSRMETGIKRPLDDESHSPCETWISHGELVQLTKWKLKRGKFRPNLLNLVESNESLLVNNQAIRAFRMLQDVEETSGTPLGQALAADPTLISVVVSVAMSHLEELKGVGPATASLMLSAFSPEHIPFFSDELFRFCVCRRPNGSVDWKAKIDYTRRSYLRLCECVTKLRQRVGWQLTAVELDQMAWVFAREEAAKAELGNDKSKATKPRALITQKRKSAAADSTPQAHGDEQVGLRRSKRHR